MCLNLGENDNGQNFNLINYFQGKNDKEYYGSSSNNAFIAFLIQKMIMFIK